MKKLWMGVALAMALGAAVSSEARGPRPESAPPGIARRCASSLAKLGGWKVPRWLSALAIGAVLGPPVVDQTIQHSLHHEVVAAVTGDHHLGAGIYFDDGDWRRVRDFVGVAGQGTLDAVPRDEMAVVRLWTQQVHGDYDESRIPPTELTDDDRQEGLVAHRYHDYPWGIRGSHFVVAKGQPRGNCDHKARVLAELLRRSGLDAHVERAMLKEGVAHAYVVVRLSDGEWIADGTEGEVTKADRYRARNVAYRIDYFGRPWPEPGK